MLHKIPELVGFGTYSCGCIPLPLGQQQHKDNLAPRHDSYTQWSPCRICFCGHRHDPCSGPSSMESLVPKRSMRSRNVLALHSTNDPRVAVHMKRRISHIWPSADLVMTKLVPPGNSRICRPTPGSEIHVPGHSFGRQYGGRYTSIQSC